MPPKKPVSSYHNKILVDLFSKHLSHIEHFIFYGTLLGLVREGQPIEDDDDVEGEEDLSETYAVDWGRFGGL